VVSRNQLPLVHEGANILWMVGVFTVTVTTPPLLFLLFHPLRILRNLPADRQGSEFQGELILPQLPLEGGGKK